MHGVQCPTKYNFLKFITAVNLNSAESNVGSKCQESLTSQITRHVQQLSGPRPSQCTGYIWCIFVFCEKPQTTEKLQRWRKMPIHQDCCKAQQLKLGGFQMVENSLQRSTSILIDARGTWNLPNNLSKNTFQLRSVFISVSQRKRAKEGSALFSTSLPV